MVNEALQEKVQNWLVRDPEDWTRDELKNLLAKGDEAELAKRFAGRLEFGTAGLRGFFGAGPMRMNRLVVRETSAGLAAYLKETVPEAEKKGIAIAYDGRHFSAEFAQDAAAVFCAMGFNVHTYQMTEPTPLLAYTVLATGAAAGVMVTASHNPPQYNGYKVYWGNGAQIIPPHDKGIAAAIDVAATKEIPFMDLIEAEEKGLLHIYGGDMEERYIKDVMALCHAKPLKIHRDLKIAYTPMHGVGAKIAMQVFKRAAFVNSHIVTSQEKPDGDFPTVKFPNPEEPGATDLLLAKAREIDADIAIANDPDADRLAVAVKVGAGEYQQLTGDMVGALLGAWVIENTTKKKDPSSLLSALVGDWAIENTGAERTMGNSLVSSRMLGAIAKKRGVHHYESLTGFKWITNVGMKYEAQGKKFIFGYEEALGYTIGTLVRDKDGISALLAFSMMAAALKAAGKTVMDRWEELCREVGLHLGAQKSLALTPEMMAGPSIGSRLRANMPKTIAGRAVVAVSDIQNGVRIAASGEKSPLDFPVSDVLVFELADGSRVIIRPSGTEPKVKCYYEVVAALAAGDNFAQKTKEAQDSLASLIAGHQAELAKV